MQSIWKLPTVVVSALAVLGAGGFAYSRPAGHPYVMVPAGAATFAPLDPKNPQGLQRAVLSGDPRVGPVAFIMKFPKGRLPLHFHSSDYYAWIVEGKMKHWLAGKEAEAKESPPRHLLVSAGRRGRGARRRVPVGQLPALRVHDRQVRRHSSRCVAVSVQVVA